ncbi:hypothetical protein JT359_01065 [Candidatus Poribacteria bacterium]|nr:hypothetical protein [Candidatus Poribacteria bacterium]
MDIQSIGMNTINLLPTAAILFWTSIIAILSVLVHIVFGFGVYLDALRLRKEGRRIFFVHTSIWFFATLIGGVLVAGVYWVLHHSLLNPSLKSQQIQNDEKINT